MEPPAPFFFSSSFSVDSCSSADMAVSVLMDGFAVVKVPAELLRLRDVGSSGLTLGSCCSFFTFGESCAEDCVFSFAGFVDWFSAMMAKLQGWVVDWFNGSDLFCSAGSFERLRNEPVQLMLSLISYRFWEW